MTNFKKRILKWLGIFLLTAFSIFIVLTLFLFYRALTAWTIVGDSTSITYTVTSQSKSLQPLKQVVDAVAKKHEIQPFKSNEESLNYDFGWENSTGILGNKKYQLSLRIDTYPRDEPDARKRTVLVGIATSDSGKSDEWQQVAKDIELALAPVAKVDSVSIGLDAAVYGLCTSKERPTRADTHCSFEVPFPVDFKTFNEKILEPRAREQKKNPKSAPNF